MPKSHQQIPALDGIRGMAILTVLVCHSAYHIETADRVGRLVKGAFYTGWAGVDLFFVLSGFLITGILLRTKRSSNYFRSFYMRRFLRIFPLYYAVLIATLLIVPHSQLLAKWIPVTFAQRASYFLYLQNFPVFWKGGWLDPNLIGHFWSLAVEEQFYLVWPVVVLLLSERALLMLSGTVLAIAAPLRLMAVAHWGSSPAFIQLTTTRIDGLLVGAALAVLLQHSLISLRKIAWVALASAFALAGILVAHRTVVWTVVYDPYVSSFGITALALLSGALVALAQHPIPMVQRVLCFGPLRDLGKYSYGMYILHPMIFILLGMRLQKTFHFADDPFPSLGLAILYIAGMIGVVYVAARISYGLFESRFLALKKYFEPDAVAGRGKLMATVNAAPLGEVSEVTAR